MNHLLDCQIKPQARFTHPFRYSPASEEQGCRSVRTRFSKRRLAFLLSLFFAFSVLVIISRKYVWLYATRKPDPPPATTNLLQDPQASKNPEILLAEANRLAWLFNSPRAAPLYVRAEELFKERGDTRN